MPVRHTSRDAYSQITKLNAKQSDMFEIIKKHGPITDLEISTFIDAPINEITPRRGELVEFGFVKAVGRKKNVTGRMGIAWVATNPQTERQMTKMFGKEEIDTKQEIAQVKKYSLTMRSGQKFTLNEAMADEIKSAQSSAKYGETITIANHVIAIHQIDKIVEIGSAGAAPAPAPKEETKTIMLVEENGQLVETNAPTIRLRSNQIPYWTRRIGIDSGRIIEEWLTKFVDGYEETERVK